MTDTYDTYESKKGDSKHHEAHTTNNTAHQEDKNRSTEVSFVISCTCISIISTFYFASLCRYSNKF